MGPPHEFADKGLVACHEGEEGRPAMASVNRDTVDTNTETADLAAGILTTQRVMTTTGIGGPAAAEQPLYPPEGPVPAGTKPGAIAEMEAQSNANPDTGAGIEGEEVVWDGRYSMRNFLGRIAFRMILSAAWVVLAVETWANHHNDWSYATIALGLVLLAMWLGLAFRLLSARYGHEYRLTNRRLFVSTGVARRRRDQMELLRVKDVYLRQSLSERWLSVGSVVVVSTEHDLPTFYLTGVDDPKQVMDLVWHHARSERDHRSSNVHPV